ncbi:hypothetical protein Nepgr_020575 [Nepenthes gracilis]|uniref:Homeobox domain-containing protein n=1 Tax=Nepenthes gracilis TaxID=150966 RepID=A0AAD3XW70_NEPGR|nr:hypothetical protein Nepgr_020575 [Nepenthes gracilis]
MELALSLGDTSKSFSFLEKKDSIANGREIKGSCMRLALNARSHENTEAAEYEIESEEDKEEMRVSSDSTLQLHLLPFSLANPGVQPRTSQLRPWLPDNLSSQPDYADGQSRGLDVNRLPSPAAVAEEAAEEQSSPNSAGSSFNEFSVHKNGSSYGKSKRVELEGHSNGHETETEKATSRASDDEENDSTRKKLRLSKEQSAFLEESFKEHHTLNPKQKLALAKQLNLRPRQVEVWFQNRRARTKLKQTEVDFEYLKRCCEKLTEENRRLQRELQELRGLKTSQPFYMQLPATTLIMCPSCERVSTTPTVPSIPATTTTLAMSPITAAAAETATTSSTALSL